jgi:NADPH:quinone reductase-like Zn-dependent oxidoreductase
MKASINKKYGPPSVLTIQEIEQPVPKDNEILVKIHATTVNRTDCAYLRAKPFFMRLFTGLLKPKKTILGTDFAGVVEAVGKKVSTFNPGNKVFGFNDLGIRSHAQYMTIFEKNSLDIMPDNITFEEAAASIEGAHYAYNMINKVDLRAGQKVLVNGGTGSIGSAAVQLSHYFGAEVTATCETTNADLVKSLGAVKVIDYTKEDFTNSTEKYDYVFDSVGKSTFGKCKSILNTKGVYLSSELGPWAQNVFFALMKPIIGKKKVLFPLPLDRDRSIRLIKKLILEGKFAAVIDRTFALDDIADAFRYVETGQKIGNVVISMVEK